MVRPAALLRTSAAPAPAAAGRPQDAAKRLLRSLSRWMAPEYRPERHYMRGGRTAGAKSLAAAG